MTSPHIRRYVFDTDEEYVDRILLEVGWRTPGDSEAAREARRSFHAASTAFVAELDGVPECFVSTMPGSYRYRGDDLPFVGVTAVATSVVARKQGLASRTTAAALAHAAKGGAVVAGLGIFDQGFYDKLGFGTGGYEHFAMIDPSSITVPYCTRTPVRLSADDVAEIHAARLARRRGHGSVSLDPVQSTALPMHWFKSASYGLGFRDPATGRLTHHVWLGANSANFGPYRTGWIAFETVEQFIELLGLLRNLGDQLYLVWVQEPWGVQIQDYVSRPFRRNRESKKSDFETGTSAEATFQYRLLDIERAFAATAAVVRLPEFTMRVTDPVAKRVAAESGWSGLAGDYRVGPDGATRTTGVSAPDLTIGVGDLTRAWSGVVPISTLAPREDVDLSADLAARLDAAFAVAPPRTEWLY